MPGARALRRRNLPAAIAAIVAALLLAGCFGGSGNRAGKTGSGRYSHTLHTRFYEAWVQPEIVGAPRGKVSVPVDVRIDPRGRVLSFTPAKPSGFRRIDDSIAAVGRRVRKVPAPPIESGEYKLRIFFVLDVKR